MSTFDTTADAAARPAGQDGQDGPAADTLGWFDGFSLAMCIPNGIITSLGYTIAAVGAWPGLVFWGLASGIAFLQNYLYAEMAPWDSPSCWPSWPS